MGTLTRQCLWLTNGSFIGCSLRQFLLYSTRSEMKEFVGLSLGVTSLGL